MKVVVTMDSFKGSLSSMEAGQAVKKGIQRACEANVAVMPAADGGEGTTEALIEGLGGDFIDQCVTGPMGTKVTARYGILKGGETAVMEMAEASGITLVDRGALNPWRASTTGVGEMILDAADRGCRSFIIGIGGSATTEGGIGMLTALGYEFYDENNQLLPPVLESLPKISYIRDEKVPTVLKDCQFQIACDVTNPLCGENGAVYVYGPQKGVPLSERQRIDGYMHHYARKTAEFTGTDHSETPGAGAAGGLGFAFLSYFPRVSLKPGVEIVLDAVRLEEQLKDADLVVTGEGRLDAQTAMGKVPVGVAQLAKKYGCRVIAFAGSVADGAEKCNEKGIDAFFPIVRGITTLEEAMEKTAAEKNMADTAEQVFRLLGCAEITPAWI